jgi:alanyl-tRNA synthetase
VTLPERDTRVTYAVGALEATGRVLHVGSAGDLIAVITDRTSFHPVDAAWPDQPADAGIIRTGNAELPVRDALVAATDGTVLRLGADIPARPGTEGWTFVVAHLVDAGSPIAEGDEVEIQVDAATRHALSTGHTACHLASLALNRALADRWSKPVREDALGNPDFDAAAISSSRIVPGGSVDRYRLNKSLRRAGFDTASLPADLDGVRRRVADQLARWIDSGAPVRIEAEGYGLTDRRAWVCELPDGTARISCGGTHLGSLGELEVVVPSFAIVDDAGTPVLEMTNQARIRH